MYEAHACMKNKRQPPPPWVLGLCCWRGDYLPDLSSDLQLPQRLLAITTGEPNPAWAGPWAPLFRDLACTFGSRASLVPLPTAKLSCTLVPLPPFPLGAFFAQGSIGALGPQSPGSSVERWEQSLPSLVEGCSQGPFTSGVLAAPELLRKAQTELQVPAVGDWGLWDGHQLNCQSPGSIPDWPSSGSYQKHLSGGRIQGGFHHGGLWVGDSNC